MSSGHEPPSRRGTRRRSWRVLPPRSPVGARHPSCRARGAGSVSRRASPRGGLLRLDDSPSVAPRAWLLRFGPQEFDGERPMRFGLDVGTAGAWADPQLLTQFAREAEAAGWDGFFLWDLFAAEDDTTPVVDAWIVLASIAAATTRIRIGTMVTPLPRRLPWEVARAGVTLDQLSNGRLVVGAGLGWRKVEFERLGLPAELRQRADRLDEGL